MDLYTNNSMARMSQKGISLSFVGLTAVIKFAKK